MRETWHEHYLRLLLPKEMQKDCSVSLSIKRFLDIVQSHLTKIYGDRAHWNVNLQKYYQSDAFTNQCQAINSIDDLEELSVEDIERWISEEKQFSSSVGRLIELLPVIEARNQSEMALLEASQLLGLLGPNPDAIFQWMIDWDGITEQEIQAIQEKIASHFGEFVAVVSILIKLCINGRLITYPVLETVMTQQKTRYYYRGENAFYGSSKPGAFRRGKGKPEWLVHQVNALRRNEGCEFLDNFLATFAWPYSATNHYAICQHYGLLTEIIDITSDVWAALFFACTKYDNGTWRPLTKHEIEESDSRSEVFKRGGDSRYGVLYRRLAEPVELEWLFKDENDFWDTIFPIGYQPYMRCAYQHAYGLFENDTSYDLYKDKSFSKYKIRLTEELCNWVFEQTHQGKDIFPVDDIPDLSAYMRRINDSHHFSWDSFEAIMVGQGIPRDEWRRIQLEMMKNGYVIEKGKVDLISSDEIARINNSYPPERAKMLTKAQPVSDPLIIVTTDEQAQRDRKADDYKYRFMMVSPQDTKELPAEKTDKSI